MTHTTKHTPGPWEWQRGERYLKLGQRNAPHESVLPPCDKVRGSVVITPNQANLRLIAAAPAMYLELVTVREYLFRLYEQGNSEAGQYAASIETALAQAEGRQP